MGNDNTPCTVTKAPQLAWLSEGPSSLAQASLLPNGFHLNDRTVGFHPQHDFTDEQEIKRLIGPLTAKSLFI